MSSIEQAEQLRADIARRLDEAKAELAANVKRRAEIALDAELADAVNPIRREHQTLTKAAAALEGDVRRLSDAASHAAHRVDLAREAAAAEDEKRRAGEAIAIIERLAQHAARADEGLRTVKESGAALRADLTALQRLGCSGPTGAMIDSGFKRALDTQLTGLHRDVTVWPPADRKSFAQLTQSWSASMTAWTARVLAGESSASPVMSEDEEEAA